MYHVGSPAGNHPNLSLATNSSSVQPLLGTRSWRPQWEGREHASKIEERLLTTHRTGPRMATLPMQLDMRYLYVRGLPWSAERGVGKGKRRQDQDVSAVALATCRPPPLARVKPSIPFSRLFSSSLSLSAALSLSWQASTCMQVSPCMQVCRSEVCIWRLSHTHPP